MKKISIVILTLMMCSIAAKAQDCANGIVETGVNGNTYCRAKVGMNWYSALVWCQKQGMHLVTMTELCDKDDTPAGKWDGTTGSGKCLNFASGQSSFNGYVWTSTISSSTNAYYVRLSNSTVSYSTRSYGSCYPLCK